MRKFISILFAVVLVLSFSLIPAMPVAANGPPNPTFCTLDVASGTTPSSEISIGWERGGIHYGDGTDAIHVTTSQPTLDYAMVIVPTDFVLGGSIISYWGYTVGGDVKAPDEIFLFLDAEGDDGAFDTLLTSHKPGPPASDWYTEWHEWNSTDPLNDWHTAIPYVEANPDDYSGARVLAIALTAGPSTELIPVNVGVYFDKLTVNGDVLLDNDTGTIDVPVPFPGQLAPSIQDAIDAALPEDTITVAAGTYNENVVINESVTIQGAGVSSTIVDGGDSDRVFLIGSVEPSVIVTILGMTIQNGSAEDMGGGVYSGAGIRNEATLTLNNCTVTNNTATIYGGGITNMGTMTIGQCTISGNTATGLEGSMGGVGGGIFNAPEATLTMTNSTISGNTASAGAFGGDGGGIQNGLTGPGGVLTMTNCTVSGNTAGSAGGGIGSNWTSGTPGGMTLTNVTITDNEVTGGNNQGGGIFIYGGTHVVKNTIVAGNTASVGDPNIMKSSCTWTASNCITSGDPLLGLLQDNGGSTETHALLLGSPAIDTGDDIVCPATDQRGVSRPQGPASSDIGSYEVPYTVYVDDNWTGPEDCGGHVWGADAFAIIQDGIDAVAEDGTVNVAAGEYNLIAPIAVTENVTLTGDVTTPSNVVVDAGTITGDDRDCFQVKASGVTIQGFKMQGALDAPGTAAGTQNSGVVIGDWWVGAAIPGLQDIVISYNEITNCSKGISVYRAQHVEISYNNIHHNLTSDDRPGSWPGKGIMLYGDGPSDGIQNNDIDILKNEIYNNGLFGIELNHWETDGTAWVDVAVLIDGNIIYNNGMSWDDVGYAVDCGRGISANGHETGVTITNNEVYGHWSTSGKRFASSAAGIRVNDSKGFVISNNNVHDNMRGIYIYGDDTTFGDENTGFIVTGNDVYDNAQGIVFGSGNVGYAHFNDIYNNNVGTYTGDGVDPCGAVNLDAGTFDATNNWWGNASGPSDVGPGTGDAVSGNVDYDPWTGAATEEAKSETVTGSDTIDQSDTVTGMGDIDIDATGDHTVTTAKYEGNPGGTPIFQSSGNYYDVHLDDDTGVNSLTINFCPATATTVIYYWNGTSWVRASSQAFAGGCITVTITATTTPSLADLTGAVFGSSAPTPAPSIAGGDWVPPPAAVSPVGSIGLSPYLDWQGKTTIEIRLCSADGLVTIVIPLGTLMLDAEGNPLGSMETTILAAPPPAPEDCNVIGLVYDFGPEGATFEPGITMIFTYDPADIPDEVSEEGLVLAYWDGDKWVILPTTVNTVANTATAEVAYFTPFTILAYTRLAAFVASDLSITPAEVDIGGEVTISLLVANTGNLAGSYKVTLKINGVEEATRDVIIEAGASEEVTFTTAKDVAETYEVTVDGLSGTFVVKEVAPTPALPPPSPPVLPPAKVMNWWLIGGVIAGCIIIGMLILLAVRRRY